MFLQTSHWRKYSSNSPKCDSCESIRQSTRVPLLDQSGQPVSFIHLRTPMNSDHLPESRSAHTYTRTLSQNSCRSVGRFPTGRTGLLPEVEEALLPEVEEALGSTRYQRTRGPEHIHPQCNSTRSPGSAPSSGLFADTACVRPLVPQRS